MSDDGRQCAHDPGRFQLRAHHAGSDPRRSPSIQDEQEPDEPTQPRHEWQKVVSLRLENKFISDEVWPTLSIPDGALMRCQSGPFSSVALIVLPTSRYAIRHPTFPVATLSARSCRCGRPLDAFGHHRSACATSGVPESVAARVCREVEASVRINNVMVRDMDLLPHDRVDTRRLLRTVPRCMVEPILQWTPYWCGHHIGVVGGARRVTKRGADR